MRTLRTTSLLSLLVLSHAASPLGSSIDAAMKAATDAGLGIFPETMTLADGGGGGDFVLWFIQKGIGP
jgi:hypothetical protein